MWLKRRRFPRRFRVHPREWEAMDIDIEGVDASGDGGFRMTTVRGKMFSSVKCFVSKYARDKHGGHVSRECARNIRIRTRLL